MKTHALSISVAVLLLTSCTGLNKKMDCRFQVDASQIKKEMLADIKERFPDYKSLAISDVGLGFDESGTAYYPATVIFKKGEIYSVIYNYSPTNSECKKLGYQYIKLLQTTN
jgi:hypothetical protein